MQFLSKQLVRDVISVSHKPVPFIDFFAKFDKIVYVFA